MSVVSFADYLKALVNSGSAIEGNVVKVIADNGDEIGDAIFKVVQGGNGVSSEVGVAVQTTGTGATATGLAYLTLDVGVVGAAIAPALGVVAGVGLYSLAPDFWETVSNTLRNAGKTIGGKVIGYWNGDNLHLDEETIEIFKNALIAAGIFDSIYTAPEIDTQTNKFTLGSIDLAVCKNQCAAFVQSCNVTAEHKAACLTAIANSEHNIIVKHYYHRDYPTTRYSLNLWSDAIPDNMPIEYNLDTENNSLGIFQAGGTRLYRWTVGGYYGDTAFFRFDIDNPSYIFRWQDYAPFNQNLSGEDACMPHFGSFEASPNVQDDATLPTQNPFPLTYPNWIPWEYPASVDPSELPDVYPIKYPETDPDPYPSQDPAQNPDPEPAPDIIPEILPDFNLPDPSPEPAPEPEPDPDPQPEPDPIPGNPDPTPAPDPADPNPTPTPSPIVPVPSLPATVSSNKLFTVYNPSAAELNALGAYLWDGSIIAAIRDIWQEPLDGIISLIQVYATPATSGSHNIILGFLDSGVSAAVVSNQFVTIDCGSVTVPEDKQNATDYAPYTSLHLFLPFIGMVELDTNECMNATISVKYKVDVYTGTCLANVSVARTADMPNDPILYTYSGNCAQQIPLTSGNATGMLSALIGGITAGLSVASGGGLGVVAGASIAGQSLAHDMFHVNHSGNLSANAGILGQKKPYLIIGRRHGYDANNYSTFYGYPANKTVVLGNHTGYVKVKKCYMKTSATQPEHNMIMELLTNGVIL